MSSNRFLGGTTKIIFELDPLYSGGGQKCNVSHVTSHEFHKNGKSEFWKISEFAKFRSLQKWKSESRMDFRGRETDFYFRTPLFRLARSNPKSKRNKENRHFLQQITGNNRGKSHRGTRIPSVISWRSKIFVPAGHQLTITYFIVILQFLRVHDRLYQLW